MGFCVAKTWKGVGRRISLCADGHFVLLHGLQHRRLRFGRRAVDFVRQDQIGKNRTRQELKPPLATGRVLLDNVRAGDVRRHEVGGELDSAEGKVQRPGQATDQQRLGQPRHPHNQGVAAAEDREQHIIDHLPAGQQ